ncbi:unnamed protein product, partial [Mesorhabditis spiculigera]
MVEVEIPLGPATARRRQPFSDYSKKDQERLMKICGHSDGKPCITPQCVIVQTKEVQREKWVPVLIGEAFPKPTDSPSKVMRCWLSIGIFLYSATTTFGWFYGRDEPDAWTQGGVFPLPALIKYGHDNITLSPKRFLIQAGDHEECDIVAKSVETYVKKWMFPFPVEAKEDFPEFGLQVTIEEKCPTGVPPDNMIESYSLSISKEGSTLRAQQVWGFLRGLETFSQLIFYDEESNSYLLRTVEIADSPRYTVRGLMLDTSRHFLPKKIIFRQLDLMAQNKMNVFHWHIVDSEAFPYTSEKFPKLHVVGAYSRRHVYTKQDIKDIVDYARIRGIRVMPEFDTPAHTGAWRGVEGLVTRCFDENQVETNLPNLLDASEEKTFEFLSEFFKEVAADFPDAYIHLGGDESDLFIRECWDRNVKIQQFMERNNFYTTTQLENYYFGRLQDIVANATNHKTQVFWQEVYDNNNPSTSAIVHLWKGNTHQNIKDSARIITATGQRVIVSSCWYLNYHKYGADWKDAIANQIESNAKYYYCDPRDFEGSDEQKSLVLGGIVTMWGEMVDATNIEARTWPRASAAAERLWSPAESTKNATLAWPRLHELRSPYPSKNAYKSVAPAEFLDFGWPSLIRCDMGLTKEWNALWEVDDPNFSQFDYTAKKYYICGIHVKRAAFFVLLLTFLEIILYISAFVLGWNPGIVRPFKYVVLPLVFIAALLLWWGLRDHHAFRLLPYIFVTLIQIVFHPVPLLVHLYTKYADKDGDGIFTDKNDDGREDNNILRGMSDVGQTLACMLLIPVVIYLFFIYVVHRCRKYFLDIDAAQNKNLPNVRYQK